MPAQATRPTHVPGSVAAVAANHAPDAAPTVAARCEFRAICTTRRPVFWPFSMRRRLIERRVRVRFVTTYPTAARAGAARAADIGSTSAVWAYTPAATWAARASHGRAACPFIRAVSRATSTAAAFTFGAVRTSPWSGQYRNCPGSSHSE
jgi:hypothetical protein